MPVSTRLLSLTFFSFVALLSAQTNWRATPEGTNEFATAPLRTEPKPVWDVTPRYRDSAALAVSNGVLVTGNTNGRGGTFGYDAATGKQLWAIPGHIRGAAAVDEAAAYAVNAGQNYRFRLQKLALKTGRILWAAEEEDLGNHDSGPLVVDGRVFLVSRNRTLTAYDAALGKELWKRPRLKICNAVLAHSTGTLFFSGGIENDRDNLTAVEAASGKTLWSFAPKQGAYMSCTGAPIAAGGLVVVPAGHEIYAFDAKTGAARWQQSVSRQRDGRPVRPVIGELALSNGVLYASSRFGIHGWQLDNGRPVFEFEVPKSSDSNVSRVSIAGGVLYFMGNMELPPEKNKDNGWIYALDIASKHILWKFHACRTDKYDPDGTWGTVFVLPADGALFFENNQRLVRLGH